jgi:hypothetical protein
MFYGSITFRQAAIATVIVNNTYIYYAKEKAHSQCSYWNKSEWNVCERKLLRPLFPYLETTVTKDNHENNIKVSTSRHQFGIACLPFIWYVQQQDILYFQAINIYEHGNSQRTTRTVENLHRSRVFISSICVEFASVVSQKCLYRFLDNCCMMYWLFCIKLDGSDNLYLFNRQTLKTHGYDKDLLGLSKIR